MNTTIVSLVSMGSLAALFALGLAMAGGFSQLKPILRSMP